MVSAVLCLDVKEEDSTREVYESTVQEIVRGALQGYNGTVFAYGQTGSGKTHTIVGKRSDPGVLMMGVEDLFAEVAKGRHEGGGSYTLRVGILEIYNEEMRDLGAPSQAQRLHQGENRLQIKEDPVQGVKVNGLHEEVVESVGRVKVLLDRGMSRRQTAATKMNDTSSRSHTIFRITIENKRPNMPLRVSYLNFVDLAGSERLEKTENTGARAGESAHINLSLLMLGNVISKLAEGRALDHIPFRNSKLTRILQPSLGGNARTAVIATINPGTAHADETSHTLRFASRAMTIVNTVQVNEVLSDVELIQRYKVQVAEMSKRIRKMEGGDTQKEVRHLRRRCAELEDENEQLVRKLEYVSNNAAVLGDGGGSMGPSPPRTPPDLNLPAVQPRRGAAQITDAIKALAAIGRVANLGKARGAVDAQPEAVLQAVRLMRAERDELRRRDAKHRQQEEHLQEQLEDHLALIKERGVIADATAILEDLVGGRAPHATLAERLREAVETTAMISAEMSSMQRQHASIAVLLKQEEANRQQAEEQLAEFQKRSAQLKEVEKGNFVLQEEKSLLLQQRDEFAKQLGKDPARLFPPGGSGPLPGEQAFKYADVLEKRMKVFESLAAQRESERSELKAELAEWAGIPQQNGSEQTVPDEAQIGVVGSAAVRAARLAKRETYRLQRRAEEAEARCEEMQGRLVELEQEVGELASANAPADGDQDDDAVVVDRMKKRVYALSREVASLTRERDDLLTRLMDSSLASSDVQVWSAVHSIPEDGHYHEQQHKSIRSVAGGPASASAAETRPMRGMQGDAAAAQPGFSSAPPHVGVPGVHVLPMPVRNAPGHHPGFPRHRLHAAMPETPPAWQDTGPERHYKFKRGNSGQERPRPRREFDNRPNIPESARLRQREEDRALRDPYFGKQPILEEIQLPPPGQKRKPSAKAQKRPLSRSSAQWSAGINHHQENDPGYDTLRLRQRLVALERSRAELAARAAEEKRSLELKLAARDKAAIVGKGVEAVVKQKEAEAVEKAQLAEQYRIERDELSAAMQHMAEENAKLKADMAEWRFYKSGMGK